MRPVDPYKLRFQESKDSVLFAGGQLQGTQKKRENAFLNFDDQCFVVADSVVDIPHGKDAVTLAMETTIWGYKLLIQRRFYRVDKYLFMKHLYRSTNLAVWQKKREIGFEEGLATTLLTCVIGSKNFWLANAGDSSAWLFTNGAITKITNDDIDATGALTKYVGAKRLGLLPTQVSGKFEIGDVILLTTAGVGNYLLEKDMKESIAGCGTTTESLSNAVMGLCKAAEKNGSKDNKTAVIIKRVLNK